MAEVTRLPRMPSGGNRRRLDELWLVEVERRGVGPFLDDVPSEPPAELRAAVDQFNAGAYWGVPRDAGGPLAYDAVPA